MIRRYAEEKMRQFQQWAIERQNSHKEGSSKKVDPNHSDLDIHRLGIMGEFAVWEITGGKWNRFHPGGKWPDYDIVSGKWNIEVKTTFQPKEKAHFYFPSHQTFKGNLGFLVVGLEGEDNAVDIAGSILREDFERKKAPCWFDPTALGVKAALLDPEDRFFPGPAIHVAVDPNCWHCAGTNSCDCITCGRDVAGGRVSGPCQACRGRDFHFRHRDVLEKFPPEDFANWRTVAAADGNKGYRVYIPFEGLK